MAQLPIPGQHVGTWGDVLNEFLLISHERSGQLKSQSVGLSQLDVAGSAGNGKVLAYHNGSLRWQSPAIAGGTSGMARTASVAPVDTAIVPAGTAQARLTSATPPADPNLVVNTVNGQSGDIVLDKTYVGLDQVDNTADVDKPVSTATQAALDAKADDEAVVHVTGDEAVAGVKTFAVLPMVPTTDPTDTAQVVSKQYARKLLANRVSKPTAMQPFYAALANRAYAPCDVLFIGDSITEGTYSTTFDSRTQGVVRDALRRRYPTTGVAGGAGYMAAYLEWLSYGGTYKTATVSGSPSKSTVFGLGLRSYQLNKSTSDKLTYTVSGTSVDVLTANGAFTGTMSVSVDGGTAVTFNTNRSSNLDAVKNRVTFKTRGSHTVAISCSVGSIFVGGIMVYDQDENAGLRFWDGAHFGYTTASFISPSSLQTTLQQQIASIKPALVIIALGTNDWQVNDQPTFQTNLATMISTIKAGTGTPTPSIVLQAFEQPNLTSGKFPWQGVVDTMYTLADADPRITVNDLSLRLPQIAGDDLGLYGDSVHPSNKGQSLIAEMLTGFLAV